MKVIILAGGWGTRLEGEDERIPKPMVPIGSRPILWHIMKIYSHYGFNEFIICLGVKADVIKNYFYSYSRYLLSMQYEPFFHQVSKYYICYCTYFKYPVVRPFILP